MVRDRFGKFGIDVNDDETIAKSELKMFSSLIRIQPIVGYRQMVR